MAEHMRISRDAGNVAMQAYEHAIRLEHRYLGSVQSLVPSQWLAVDGRSVL